MGRYKTQRVASEKFYITFSLIVGHKVLVQNSLFLEQLFKSGKVYSIMYKYYRMI